jgi:HPt (histidine-containing phosphotransfer) domain-containing protein
MPAMDGYATTRQIRATPRLAHLPVVALSAGAFKTQQTAAIEAGMDDFVAKPFNVDKLVAVVQRHAGSGRNATPAEPAEEEPASARPPAELIDVPRGLRNWRDAGMFRERLRSFCRDYLGAGRQILASLQQQDAESAEFLAHRLRGAAGAMALMQVVDVAGEVEQALHHGQDASAATELLIATLADTAVAIDAYAPPPAAPTEVAKAADGAAVREHLERLRKVLDSDDLDLIEPALQRLAGALPEAQIRRLRASIDAFDFRGAEALVGELSASLGLHEKE